MIGGRPSRCPGSARDLPVRPPPNLFSSAGSRKCTRLAQETVREPSPSMSTIGGYRRLSAAAGSGESLESRGWFSMASAGESGASDSNPVGDVRSTDPELSRAPHCGYRAKQAAAQRARRLQRMVRRHATRLSDSDRWPSGGVDRAPMMTSQRMIKISPMASTVNRLAMRA